MMGSDAGVPVVPGVPNTDRIQEIAMKVGAAIDGAPVADTLSALILVVGATICSVARGREQPAKEGAEIFSGHLNGLLEELKYGEGLVQGSDIT